MDNDTKLGNTSAAFGLSAACTVIFNTVLAWIENAYDPLNAFMQHLSGHRWTTHGLMDILVFILFGIIFMSTGAAARIPPDRLVAIVAGASIIAGLGLAAWFVLLF